MKKNQSLKLTETAIMLALGVILSMLAVVDMPFGGKVTAFSMLPIAVIAYRYKTAWGFFAGFTYSLLQMVLGLKNLSYATSAVAVIAIVMLDYVVAFTLLGLCGIFRGKIKDHGIALASGTLLACVLRYICHVISGCTVWAGVSIPTSDGLIYSLAYNAAYMIPETLITVVAAYFAGKAFTLTTDKVKRIKLEDAASVKLYSAIPVSLAIVVAFVLIFGMMQTEDGFDITGIASADVYSWVTVAVITVVGILASVTVSLFMNKHAEDESE